MKPFSQKCHGFYSLFLLFFSPLEKRDWTILWGGETLVPRGEEEGLCVWSISDHAGQIHQHVCSIGWVEKYEVQREEWPFSLQAVSGEEQQDPGFCCQDTDLPRDGSSCSFSDSFLFKSIPFTRGTDYLETRDALAAVRQLSKPIFFMLFFQQQKVLLPLNAKWSNTSVLVYSKHNEYTLLNAAFLFKFERKLAFWSLVLLLSCPVFGIHFRHL